MQSCPTLECPGPGRPSTNTRGSISHHITSHHAVQGPWVPWKPQRHVFSPYWTVSLFPAPKRRGREQKLEKGGIPDTLEATTGVIGGAAPRLEAVGHCLTPWELHATHGQPAEQLQSRKYAMAISFTGPTVWLREALGKLSGTKCLCSGLAEIRARYHCKVQFRMVYDYVGNNLLYQML